MTTLAGQFPPIAATIGSRSRPQWRPQRVFLMRAHEALLGRRTFSLADSLARSQYWPADRLRELQLAKLRRLIDHAGTHCPYYRQLPRGDSLRGLEDLAALPLLDRSTLQRHARAMSWQALPGKKLTDRTRGTTDEPVPYYWDRNRQAWDKANRLRGHAWHGLKPGDRELHLWPVDPPVNLRGHVKHWVRERRDHLFQERQIDSLTALGPGLSKTWSRWRRFDPLRVTAYPSVLAPLLEQGARAGCRVGNPALRHIFLTGEVTHAWQRRVVAEHLDAKVVQDYGVQEVGSLAFSCTGGRWHIAAESVVIEIVRDGRPARPGELGEVVVTGLESRAMPLIRYCTGDIVRAGAPRCDCGLQLPVLPPILGRSADFLESSDGAWLPPAETVESLGKVLHDGAFQVFQDRRGGVLVETAIAPADWAVARDAVVDRVSHLVGAWANCRVRLVRALRRTRFGKCRYVHSDRTAAGLARPR